MPAPARYRRFYRARPGGPTTPPPSPPVTGAPRFYGDPGPGNLYMGIEPEGSSIAVHEQKMGAPLGMERIYDGSTGNVPWAAVDRAIAGGRIPAISFKSGGRTYQSIAAGSHDAWIDDIARNIASRSPWPVPFCVHHEPDDDAETGGAKGSVGRVADPVMSGHYRAACRRIAKRIKAVAGNAVFVCTYYMSTFTFQQTSGTYKRDWREFYPDWKKTNGVGLGTSVDPVAADFWVHGDPESVVDIIGLDMYHFWALGEAASRFFLENPKQQMDIVADRTGLLGKPYGIGEWGTMAAQSGVNLNGGTLTAAQYQAQVDAGTITFYPEDTRRWIREYYDLRLRGVVFMDWWDNDVDNNFAGPGTMKLSQADPFETRWKILGELTRLPTTKRWTPGGLI